MLISWNIDHIRGKKMTKRAFIARYKGAFPGVDLGAEYDKIYPKKRRKKADS